MGYTLEQAAKAVGLSKTSVQRAIKSGPLSATRLDDGSYAIDPAELHRTFEMKQSVTCNATGELRVEVEMLRERISEKDETIADLRRRLDESETERRQAQERLTALLTDQRPGARRSWWRRLGR